MTRPRERVNGEGHTRYVCPYCGRASANPRDRLERYCGCCGFEDGALPKDCPHRLACPYCGRASANPRDRLEPIHTSDNRYVLRMTLYGVLLGGCIGFLLGMAITRLWLV